ncbi:MAG: N-acetyltransferase [Flavobacterium sp.]|uniref:GNAT family N-acetyltransferase n=1 Tax=Flavobacterium sp. TaxID=239 RepID=UPI001228ABFC|nr:GNAT family N-acetyltransferase [Flavobacterium sp.]RZJ63192.1 MAG: N-acetyltransferase [Flavobacterium sp.]
MKTTIESERLVFRELRPSDDGAMFALDSDPDVMRYLGVKPLESIEQTREIIKNINQQYLDYGIGRWAAILKDSNTFIGWAGLKFIRQLNGVENTYDLGYRFLKPYWGKGYGHESAKAFIDFGFDEMRLPRITAYVDVNNSASIRILEKCGLKFVNNFMDEGDLCAWYEIDNQHL